MSEIGQTFNTVVMLLLVKAFLFFVSRYIYLCEARELDLRDNDPWSDRVLIFSPVNVLKPATSTNVTLTDAFIPTEPRYMPADTFPIFIGDFLDWVNGEIFTRGTACQFNDESFTYSYYSWQFSINRGSGMPLMVDIRSAGEVVRDNIGHFLERSVGSYREIDGIITRMNTKDPTIPLASFEVWYESSALGPASNRIRTVPPRPGEIL